MKYVFTFLFVILIIPCFSQELKDKNITIGMSVRINKCKPNGKSFESMDLYTKTRYPKTGIKIDSLTGGGIFENFFAPGDFDAKRLPCSYGGKKYRIAALRVFEQKDGPPHRVVICYTSNKLSMIWIEIDKAIELKEVEF